MRKKPAIKPLTVEEAVLCRRGHCLQLFPGRNGDDWCLAVWKDGKITAALTSEEQAQIPSDCPRGYSKK